MYFSLFPFLIFKYIFLWQSSGDFYSMFFSQWHFFQDVSIFSYGHFNVTICSFETSCQFNQWTSAALIFVYFIITYNLFLMCTSGIIRTAVSNLDRESRDHYAVVIQAKDMAGSVGGLSGSTTVNITLTDVNDNPPKFSQSKWSILYTNNIYIYIYTYIHIHIHIYI